MIVCRSVALGLFVCLFSAASAAAQAQLPESGTVKSQHGDWQVVCKPPPPGAKNEVCALVQSVTAEDRNNVGLTVYFQRFSDGKRVEANASLLGAHRIASTYAPEIAFTLVDDFMPALRPATR